MKQTVEAAGRRRVRWRWRVGAAPAAKAEDVTLRSGATRPTSRRRSRSASWRQELREEPSRRPRSRSRGTRRIRCSPRSRPRCPRARARTSSTSSPTRPNTSPPATSFRSTISVNWNNIEPWARKVWTHNGKTYGIPQEAYTVELYYNKDMLKKLGVALPANGAVHAGAVPRPREEGARRRHDADRAGRRRPSVSGRLHHGRSAAAQARHRTTIRSSSPASCRSPIRASSRCSSGSRSWSTPAPIRRTS